MPKHPGDGCGLEQVTVVFQGGLELLARLRHRQGYVELGGSTVHLQRAYIQVCQFQSQSRGILAGEHDLEQRRATGVSLDLERLHHLLKRHILMSVGL